MATITKEEVAKLAFIKLRSEGNKDAALKLAAALLNTKGIILGIGDIDWNIQRAIDHCTNCAIYPYSTNIRGAVHFSFVGQIAISTEQQELNRLEFYDNI